MGWPNISPNYQRKPTVGGVLRTFLPELGFVAVCSMFANLLMLTPTIYMLQVFDRVMLSRSDLTLLAVSIVTLFMFMLLGLFEWIRSRVLVKAGVRFDEILGTKVFQASFRSYLSRSNEGPSRAFSDLLQVRQFLTGQGVFVIFDLPWVPIYLAVLFLLHPALGWLAVAFALVQAALAWYSHRSTLAPTEQAAQAQLLVNQFLQSKLRNAEVLESMGMLGRMRQRWTARHEMALHLGGVAQGAVHRQTAVSKFVRYSQQSLVLGAGALLVIDGDLTPGAMIAANVLMTRALAPIDQAVAIWRSVVAAAQAWRRLDALLLDHPDRDPNLQRVRPLGRVELHGIRAGAPGRPTPILQEMSLVIEPGTVTMVMGRSGSGKSTLARVILGIWPLETGTVSLDGVPIDTWDRDELGPYLGYLPQDIELFEGTFAENIARFGKVDADKVIAAAKATGLHETILRFPRGYDTQIGVAGGLLSGGQRQRIGLARAVYGDPALIVLDEPNANLDDVGEASLLKTVVDLKARGTTIVVIAHRTTMMGVADNILLLHDGRLNAFGPRDVVLSALRTQSTQSNTAREPGAPPHAGAALNRTAPA